MKDAFGHHVWATTRLIDGCLELPPEQLATAVPGTYGSILDTQRHLVGSDAWYLRCITKDETFAIDEDHMDLRELRSAMERNGARWSQLLADELDPDAVITQVDHEDGYRKDATVGIRFAQALASRHRSPQPDLHRPHQPRRGAATDRRLGLRRRDGRVVETFPPPELEAPRDRNLR